MGRQKKAVVKHEPATAAPHLKTADQVDLRAYLQKNLGSIGQVAQKAMSPERLLKLALVARSRTPKLGQCTAISILQSMMTCAEVGLYPGSAQSFVSLVPFKNSKTNTWEAQAMIEWRGLVELARRHGDVKHCRARIVYELDAFDWDEGLHRNLTHKPSLNGDRGERTHAYAIVELGDGSMDFEVMTWAEIQKVRRSSRAADSGPWVDWPEQMAQKTVIRRLMKRLRLTDEVAEAVQADDQRWSRDAEARSPIIDIPQALAPDAAEALAQKIKGEPAPVEVVDEETGEVTMLSREEQLELDAIAAKDDA